MRNINDSITANLQNPEVLCTPKELAQLLRVSDKTIYYWVGRKEIPFIRVGRQVRFCRQVVLEYFTRKTAESMQPCLPLQNPVKKGELSRSLKTWRETFGHSAKPQEMAHG